MITTPRIIGRQGIVTIGTAITKWREFTASIMESTDDAQGSDEYGEGVVRTGGHLEGKVTGFQGAANNGATLPVPGDKIPIANFDFKIGADSALPTLTQFGELTVVAPVTYNYVKGAATFEFNVRSDVLN